MTERKIDHFILGWCWDFLGSLVVRSLSIAYLKDKFIASLLGILYYHVYLYRFSWQWEIHSLSLSLSPHCCQQVELSSPEEEEEKVCFVTDWCEEFAETCTARKKTVDFCCCFVGWWWKPVLQWSQYHPHWMPEICFSKSAGPIHRCRTVQGASSRNLIDCVFSPFHFSLSLPTNLL